MLCLYLQQIWSIVTPEKEVKKYEEVFLESSDFNTFLLRIARKKAWRPIRWTVLKFGGQKRAAKTEYRHFALPFQTGHRYNSRYWLLSYIPDCREERHMLSINTLFEEKGKENRACATISSILTAHTHRISMLKLKSLYRAPKKR